MLVLSIEPDSRVRLNVRPLLSIVAALGKEGSKMLKKNKQSKNASRGWARAAFLGALIASVNAAPTAEAQYPQGQAGSTAQQNSIQLPPLPSGPVVGQAAGPALPMQAAPAQQQAVLKTYKLPPQLVGTVGAQLQIAYHEMKSVRITTEPETGSLMVMAPASIQQGISQQLTTLMRNNNITDATTSRAAANRQTNYQLQNLSWRELEDALKRLGGSKLSVTHDRNGEVVNMHIVNDRGMQDVLQIDRRTNMVTLIGAGEEISGWAQIVHTLDKGQADTLNATHVVPLAPAAPRKVREAFQMVKATLVQEQGGQAEAEVEVGEQATAMGTLDDLGPGSGLFGDVQIEFVEEIDLVIIRGSKEDVRRTLEVINRIKEQADKTQPEIVVYPLKHANGEAVETLITELYEEVYAARQGNISITALGQPNALLLIGRAEVVKTVEELIQKIDQPLSPENQLKVIPLLHASAVDIEERVQQFFVQQPGGNDEERVGLGTRVKVLADYRTNSLIVQASPRELIEVEKLIDSLDVETSSAQNDVQVFRLKNALAEDLETVLSDVIGGQATADDGSQATPPSGKVSLVTVDGGRIESGILAGVVITSDTNNNALVVRAPAQSMLLIGKLIDELDQTPGAEARIKVFQLQNGDATTMAQTLQGLFGLPVTAGQGATSNFLNNASRSNVSTGGESSLIQLQIAAEGRTNSIVVSGSESDLQVLEALVLRLDEDVVDSRKADVIWLRNATASDVATALTTYFQNLSTAQSQLSNGLNNIISQAELVNRQVFVVAEDQTNSVLLSASPENFEVAMRLIERLDRRPPMVAVQCLIAEVQLDDQFEFGTEWGIQDGLLFDRGSATGGSLSSPVFNLGTPLANGVTAGIPANVAGQALSSFGVGRASSSGPAGIVLSASSESVGVLLRALQTANRLQILNRPTITTLDNREGFALIGAKVPRVSGLTQANGITPQQTNIADVDVGLQLRVTPRVNQDGLILMNVLIDNSSIGDADQGIPIGFGQNGEVIRSPIINTTTATTYCSAYSGQTVVFAGLISKTRNTSRSQIPILGSLPLIGPAFRFDVESEQRRELMVVLTPRIINTDEDVEILKDIESSRMSWCLADVLNAHGDVGLSGGNGLWGPAKSATIYPDVQPSAIPDRVVPLDPNSRYAPQPMGYEGMNLDSPLPTIVEPIGIEPLATPGYDAGASNAQQKLPVQAVSFPTTPAQVR
ncbi:MAG: secretin N-terminal domain-containing protein [Aureliella sp.]